MAATEFDNPKALLDAIGTTLGPTDWVEITQDRVNKFADATDDHQWIHVDVERAKAGPFGATIGHGFLTMSMCAPFSAQLVRVNNIAMGINYGVNKARFITPVTIPGRIRATGELVEATEVPGGVQTVVKLTIELEGADKPAAVIEAVTRYLSV
jgi:acyl dehydratase